MLMDLNQSLVRQHNEELMDEAHKWHLQKRLRANREQLDRGRTTTGVIEMKQQPAALMTLQLRKVRPVRSMKVLALRSSGTTVERLRQYAALRRTTMKGIYMKEIKHLALRGIRWMGKGVLLSLGLVAMVALLIVMGVLTAVMLMATALPASAVRHKGERKGRRESTNPSEISAPREKAVAS